MQDRFKFRYIFTKDFGGKTGVCYKMPIFNLDTITDENFNKIVKSYIDYDYKLISVEQCTGLKDKNDKLIYEGDIVRINNKDIYIVEWLSTYSQFHIEGYGVLDITLSSTYEVVGSIYEDPELLENKQ